jgi:hypothetical protein
MTDISNPATGGTAEPLPPVGTAAYQEISGDDGTPPKSKNALGRTGIIAGVAALVIGILGGLGIGYAVWGTSSSSTTANGFPNFRGGAGNFTPPGGIGAEGGTRTGRFGGGAGFAGPGASGKVASVSGNTIEVQGSGSQTTVNLNANTKVTKTVSGTAADVTTGTCVRVLGSTSSNGTVTASTIVLSQPTNGTCSTGFARPGGANGVNPPGAGQ